MRHLLIAAAAAVALSGCAVLKAQPTAEDCARLAAELAVANNALQASQVAMQAATDAGAAPPVLERISKDLGIAQGAVDGLAKLQQDKCASVASFDPVPRDA